MTILTELPARDTEDDDAFHNLTSLNRTVTVIYSMHRARVVGADIVFDGPPSFRGFHISHNDASPDTFATVNVTDERLATAFVKRYARGTVLPFAVNSLPTIWPTP